MRGRAESGYAKDPMTYVPLTYVQDIERLLAELGISRFVPFGTSLGGLITMLLAAPRPKRLAGGLLNDIGRAIERAGLQGIRAHVGTGGSTPPWVHAARALAETNVPIYPHIALKDSWGVDNHSNTW